MMGIPEKGSEHFNCFCHFAKRLHERVSPQADAGAMWGAIVHELSQPVPGPHMQFVGRCVKDKNRRFWRIDAGDREFTVVYDHAADLPVTVLPDTDPKATQ